MKRLTLSFFLMLLVLLPIRAKAAGLLSPGLLNLAEETEMIVSAPVSEHLCFSKTDFENALGLLPDTVTVTAIPPITDGLLYLGDAPVTVNQTIRGASLSGLRFVPKNGCRETSFRFRGSGDYSVACFLKFTDGVNAAPVTAPAEEAVAVWTQTDIAAYGTLPGSDPDGDAILFEVAEYPKKGLIEILNASTGSYRYTPLDGVRGTDSFSYTVRDEWGAYSEPKTVTVSVDKAAANLEFADMEDHWALNAALVMAADQTMDVRYFNGKLYFDPSAEVDRQTFLKTVMKALGAGELPPAKTAFADDDEISDSASGYVARAASLGLIRGTERDGKRYFRPTDAITRAEAAVILNGILGVEGSDAIAVFADSGSVPAWARSSLSALASAGILRGTGMGQIAANSTLTRAEVAEMLLKVRQIFG